MKIKDGFILRKVADTYAAVPVGERTKEFNGMVTLNKSAAFLWEQLQKDRTEEQILDEVLAHYHTEREKALQGIQRFVETLQSADLLEA